MDFISNLIKRPISVVMNEPNEAASIVPNELTNVGHNPSSTTPPRAKSPSALIAVAMNTSINTELTDLLESAVQDLVRIEERNTTTATKAAIANTADSTTGTIQQLLHEINQNLDKVSDDDGDVDVISDNSIGDITTQHSILSPEVTLEHIESYQELSPMATKMNQQQTTTGLRASLPNATAAVPLEIDEVTRPAARESRSLDDADGISGGVFETNSTLNTFPIDLEFDAGNLSNVHVDADVNKNSKKFTGLSEFDESQIPDLPLAIAPDLAVHLKDDFLPNLNIGGKKELCSTVTLPNKLHNTLTNESEMDCNSDSDLFVECQSLNSDKYNNEQSDLDTYRSALNLEVSIEQVTSKTLENVSNNNVDLCKESYVAIELTTSKTANTSYDDEPMDVDVNETLELRNILSQQQQQKIDSHATLLVEHNKENVITSSLDAPKILPSLNNNDDNMSRETLSGYATPHEGVIIDQPQLKLTNEGNSIDNTISDEKNIELFTYKDIRGNCSESEDGGKVNLTLDMTGSFNSMKSTSTRLKSPKSVEDIKTNLTLDMTSSLSSVRSIGSSIKSPTSPSPTFPIKSVVNTAFFPHAPHEKDSISFLESCVISKTSLTSLTSEVTAMSNEKITESAKPMPTIQISAASPQKSPIAEINETVSISKKNSSEDHGDTAVLNGTFNSDNRFESNNFVVSELNKDDLKQRRTFSISPLTNESPNGGDAFSFPGTHEIRETFSVEASKEMSPASITPIDTTIDYGAAGDDLKQRRTFSISPLTNESPNGGDAFSFPRTREIRRTFSVEASKEMSPASITPIDTIIDYGAAGDGAIMAMAKDISRRTYSLPHETESIECDEPMDVDQTLPIQDETPKKQTVSSPITTLQERNVGEEQINPLISAEQLQRSISQPLPAHQHHKKLTEQQPQQTPAVSPSLPTHQHERLTQMKSKQKSNSPSLPTHGAKSDDMADESKKLKILSMSPPLPAHQKRSQIKATDCTSSETCMLAVETIFKRPSIHQREASPNATIVLEDHKLSAKERAKSNAKDEKDVIVDQFSSESQLDEIFSATTQQRSGKLVDADVKSNSDDDQFYDVEFQPNNNIILNPSDFDYLLTKGNNNVQVDRSSLLLKFDPLLGVPVPLNQTLQQQQRSLDLRTLSPTIEENENSVIVAQHQPEPKRDSNVCAKSRESREFKLPPPVDRSTKHAKMSVDVIDNDCNKTFENSNSQSEEKHLTYNKMDELEKKIRNEASLKTEDVEKKLKDAEQREESFIKRITEKDKTITKLSGVIEAYEKAIAELITEKEQVIQNYERQLNEVKADRDSNYHHLTSLETTFSDLHVKYEKSKEMTSQLKANEETLLSEKRQILDNLRLQEQRYEKMKNHAMQQLEIANKKLESVSKEHAIESTKLKALLKKEEISRASITEQLQQKTRENAELVKICDELINGQGS